MAVLNFPDPAGQSPANTFGPASTPHATSNGVTYVWTDGSWSIASGSSSGQLLDKDTADSYYVEQAGDTMTGQLTLPGGGSGAEAIQVQEVEALFVDGNGDDKFVEVAGDTMTGDLTVPNLESTGDVQMASQNGGQLAGFRNRVINGNYRVCQRLDGLASDTAITVDAFGPDRWYLRGSDVVGGSVTAGRNTRSDGNYCLRMKYNGATNAAFLQYRLESQDVADLRGQTFTISMGFDDYANTAAPSVVFREYSTAGTGTNMTEQPFTRVGTSNVWTATVTSLFTGSRYGSSGSDIGMSLNIWVNGVSTPPADGSYDFWNVQLEPGTVATPFEHRPYGTELALCQRYYQTMPRLDLSTFSGTFTSKAACLNLPATMRVTPTMSYDSQTGVNSGNIALNASVSSGSTINVSVNGGQANGGVITYATNVKFNAEL